jgi:hypothetical protein
MVEFDACGEGMRVVLMQKGQPITYFSKKFWGRKKDLLVYEKEMEVVIATILKWRNYLVGSSFII